jgi:hypothetical protein
LEQDEPAAWRVHFVAAERMPQAIGPPLNWCTTKALPSICEIVSPVVTVVLPDDVVPLATYTTSSQGLSEEEE